MNRLSELLVDDPDAKLYAGDALLVLPTLEPGSVDAIVTSPPYAGQRGAAEPDEYAEWMRPFLVQMLRVLSPAGGMLMNLGRSFRDGEEHPYVDQVKHVARELGWKHVDSIVWHKLNAHPFGAHQYLINEHEHVLWLARETGCYRGYTTETRRDPSPETIARRMRRGLRGPKNRERGGYVPQQRTPINPDGVKPGSVFECFIGREKGIVHGEPMALELAEYLVALACPPGGLILDPFAGSGTTGVAARRRHRRAILIELQHERAVEAAGRLAHVFWEARQMPFAEDA